MDSLLDEKHRSDLFSTIALEKDLPGRFSRLLQLPVSRDDGPFSLLLQKVCREAKQRGEDH